MKTIEMTGKTVDEALKNALNELKLTTVFKELIITFA